jgi:hypothetical protein
VAAALARLLDRGRRLLPVLVCALSAHALAYRSFLPRAGVHGYLGVYEALVAVLSTVALGALLLAVALVVMGRRDALSVVLAGRMDATPSVYRALWLALSAYAVLAVQESLEAGIGAAQGQAPAFDPGTLAVAVAALAASATAVALLGRSYRRVVCALLAVRLSRPRPRAIRRARPAPVATARRKPLADFRALRAPPLLTG